MIGPFNFKKINNKLLITNDLGNYEYLTKDEFYQFVNKKLDSSSDLYCRLKEKMFLFDDSIEYYVKAVSPHLRSSKSYLYAATSLHIFVVSNYCNSNCIYCQAQSNQLNSCKMMTKEIAKKSLEMVGLDQTYLEKSPFDLSGGQKRRVAIAGILAMDPDILVLDEPTAGLDPSGIKEMMDLFKKIHEMGKAVVLVTHDMNHVLEYCDNVVVMNDGQVEKAGKVKDIFLDSDYLLNLGIDLPLITNLIIQLNLKGYHIDTSINDIDALVEVIGGELHG